MRVKATSVGVVVIKGENTARILAMNKAGHLYGSVSLQTLTIIGLIIPGSICELSHWPIPAKVILLFLQNYVFWEMWVIICHSGMRAPVFSSLVWFTFELRTWVEFAFIHVFFCLFVCVLPCSKHLMTNATSWKSTRKTTTTRTALRSTTGTWDWGRTVSPNQDHTQTWDTRLCSSCPGLCEPLVKGHIQISLQIISNHVIFYKFFQLGLICARIESWSLMSLLCRQKNVGRAAVCQSNEWVFN